MNRAGRWVFSLAVVFAACGPSTPPPQSPPNANVAATGGATCESAASHLIDMMSADKKAPPPPDAVKKLHDVLVAHCQTDAWSPPLLQCLTDMKAVEDSERCESMMTPAQNEALNKERGPDDNAPAPAEATTPAASPPAAQPPPSSSRSGTAKPGKSGDPCDGGN
jgi:hypothetical protein